MFESRVFRKRERCACCGKEREFKEEYHKILNNHFIPVDVCRECLHLITTERDLIKKKKIKDAREYRYELGYRMDNNPYDHEDFKNWYLGYMRNEYSLIVDDMIDDFFAKESLSDISTFMDDPEQYLMTVHRENQIVQGEKLFTATIGAGGELYKSIDFACAELLKVNCYQEVIELYQSLIGKLNDFKETLSSEDKDNVEFTIEQFKLNLLNAMKARDEYTAKRKSILGKYSILFKNYGVD